MKKLLEKSITAAVDDLLAYDRPRKKGYSLITTSERPIRDFARPT